MRQEKRRTYLVDKKFQHAFLLRITGAVVASVVLAFVVLTAFYLFQYSQGDLTMKFFYVTGEVGTGLQETTLLRLVLPSLVVAVLLSAVFTLIFGLFYSHRIAGPLYHLRRALREVREGKLDQVVRFRKGDEFHDLAEEVTKTLAWVRDKLNSPSKNT